MCHNLPVFPISTQMRREGRQLRGQQGTRSSGQGHEKVSSWSKIDSRNIYLGGNVVEI